MWLIRRSLLLVFTTIMAVAIAGLAIWPTANAADGDSDSEAPPSGRSGPSDPSPSPAEPVTQGPLEPVPVPELSTATSTTVVNPDGSYTTRQFDVPINYETPDGSFARIDNDLVEAPGAAFAVENRANEYTASIPQNPATTPVRFELDGAWATMRMHGLAAAAPQVDDSTATLAVSPTAEANGGEAAGAAAVTYEAQNTGLKETIVLNEPPVAGAPVSYSFELATSPGLTPVLRPNGRIDFVTGAGTTEAKARFAIPVGNMTDSAATPAFTEDVAYGLERAADDGTGGTDSTIGAGWVLTVTPSLSWLSDPARVYPVAIDPTITPTTSSDCYLQQANPTTSTCGDTQTLIRVGRNNSTTLFRGLLGFDLAGIPADATVSSATLGVYLDAQTTTTAGTYAINRAGKAWNNSATWSTTGTGDIWTGGNPIASVAYGSQTIPATATGYRTFTGLGPVVQNWADGTWANLGLVLRQVGDNTTSGVNNQLQFRSSAPSAANDGKRPYLSITYTNPTSATLAEAGDRNFWTYEERELTDRVTAKVNIGTGNFHLRAEDGSIAGVAGWDLALTRYYNSAAGGDGTPSMGLGWSSAFGGSVRLEFPNGAGNTDRVQFFGVSGYRSAFEKDSSGDYVRRGPGINADLTYDSTTSQYKLKWFDESIFTFDSAGKLVNTKDKNGNQLSFTYRLSDGKLDYVDDTRGRRAQLTYTSGLITKVEFKISGSTALQWSYIYSGTPAVMIASQLDSVNGSVIGSTAMPSGTDPNPGAQMTYTYDPTSRLLTEIRDARENGDTVNNPGLTTVISYVGSTNKVATMNRRTGDPNEPDSVLSFSYYDTVGTTGPDQVCSAKDGERSAATRTFVDGERLSTDVDDTTKYCVDNQGRVLRTTDANGVRRSKSFTANSNVATADLAGLGDGQAQYQMEYDDNDNPKTAKSPTGAQTTAAYGESGTGAGAHQVSTTRGDDSGGATDVWKYRYDNEKNLIEAKVPAIAGLPVLDITYRYCWTAEGQISRIDPVTAVGAVANSTNPAAGGACNGDAAQGNDTLFTYNSQKELTSVDRPAGGDLTFTYDNLSRLATVLDERGVTTSYIYDALGRVQVTTHTQSGQTTQTVTRYLDLSGNLVGLDDLNQYNAFEYDELNRKVYDDAQSFSGATTYTYDAASNIKIVDVDGQLEPTRYVYDKLNRVTSLDDQRVGSSLITFEYDNQDKRTKTVFPVPGTNNDLVQEARFDDDGKPKCIYSYRIPNAPGNGATTCPAPNAGYLLTRFDYDYSNPANGLKTGTVYAVTELGGKTTKYTYDQIKRLDTAVTQVGSNPALRSFAYDYDRHSSLRLKDTTGTTPGLDVGKLWMAYTTGDALCSSIKQSTDPSLTCPGVTGSTQWSYDSDNNLISTTGSGPLAGLNLGYNLPAQTTSIDPPGAAGAETAAYDSVMQDRRTVLGNTDMTYGFNGLTAQSTSGGSGHRELFVRDPDGQILAMIDNNSQAIRFYLTDKQESVVATTDENAGDVIRYAYEPYGQTIRVWTDTTAGGSSSSDNSENSSVAAPTTDHNPWRYASGYHDTKTGHLKFGTRYYMPQVGSWTQPDPRDGDPNNPVTLNPFAYAWSSPTENTDPSGRYPFEDIVSIDSWEDAGKVLVSRAFGSLVGSYAAHACIFIVVGLTGGALAPPAPVGCVILGFVTNNWISGEIQEAWGYEY